MPFSTMKDLKDPRPDISNITNITTEQQLKTAISPLLAELKAQLTAQRQQTQDLAQAVSKHETKTQKTGQHQQLEITQLTAKIAALTTDAAEKDLEMNKTFTVQQRHISMLQAKVDTLEKISDYTLEQHIRLAGDVKRLRETATDLEEKIGRLVVASVQAEGEHVSLAFDVEALQRASYRQSTGCGAQMEQMVLAQGCQLQMQQETLEEMEARVTAVEVEQTGITLVELQVEDL